MPDGVVWLPANSPGSAVRPTLGVGRRRRGGDQRRCGVMPRPATRRWRTSATTRSGWCCSRSSRSSCFLVVMTLFSIVFERKVVARMQNRVGPNRVGPRGSLQSLADGLKLAFKEEIIPALADKPVYFLAPILSAVPAFLAFSRDPVRPDGVDLRPRDPAAADRPAGRRAHRLRLQLAGRLRHRAVRLGVRLDVPAARRAALGGPDDLVRGRDGAVAGRGLPLRRHDVDLRHRRRAASSGTTWAHLHAPAWSCCCSRPSSSTRSPSSGRPTARRSTCRRPSPSWSAASTPSTRR